MKIQSYHALSLKQLTMGVILLAFTLVLGSCKKDPPRTQDKCCEFKGTVTYYHEGCIPTQEPPKAIVDEHGNYFVVGEDKTGAFEFMKEGTKVCFDYELGADCNLSHVPKQGVAFVPSACVKLTCIKECEPNDDCDCDDSKCGPVKPINYLQYQQKPQPHYTIRSGRIENNKLILDIAYSGCNTAEMELALAEGINLPPYPSYFGILEYGHTMCEMLIMEEVCFDVSDYPQTTVFTIRDNKGAKSFSR